MRAIKIALAALFTFSSAFAQAWLPLRGEGTVTLNPQSLYVKDHIAFNGVRRDSGHIRANSIRAELSYGLTDRLTVSGDLLYVWAKYEGFARHGPPDDRSYNGNVQDLRLDALYALSRGRVAVTPVVRALIPVGDYSAQGHSAIGRQLYELSVGSYAGTLLEPWAPDIYVQAGYMYSFVERIDRFSLNRSNGELEVGWYLTPSLSIRGLGLWQETHDGLDLSPAITLSPHDFQIHDRSAKSQFIRYGAGGSYALNNSTAVYVLFLQTYSGKSTYASRGISTGVTWSFGSSSRPTQPR